MFQNVNRLYLQSALAASLALGSGVANAAIYAGHWDPQFNVTFNSAAWPGHDVWWSGSTQVTVDNSCLVPNTQPGVPSGFCVATLDGVTVIFTDHSTNTVIGGTAWAGLLNSIDQLSVDGAGNVDGFHMVGTLDSTIPINSVVYNFSLGFGLTGPNLSLVASGECFTCTVYQNETTPTVVWSLVPEPGSIVLAGAALAALGLTWRRRQSAPPQS